MLIGLRPLSLSMVGNQEEKVEVEWKRDKSGTFWHICIMSLSLNDDLHKVMAVVSLLPPKSLVISLLVRYNLKLYRNSS